MSNFDTAYAAYEARLLNDYLAETDGDDTDPDEEGYWESLLAEADSR